MSLFDQLMERSERVGPSNARVDVASRVYFMVGDYTPS